MAIKNNQRKHTQPEKTNTPRPQNPHAEQHSNNNFQEQTPTQPQPPQPQAATPQSQPYQQPPQAPQEIGRNVQQIIRSGTEKILDAGERVLLDDTDSGVQTIKRQERMARGAIETVQQLSAAEDAGLRRGVFAAPALAARMAQEAMPDRDRGEDSGIQATRTAVNEVAAATMIVATASPSIRFRLRRQYAEKEAKIAALEKEFASIEKDLGNAQRAAATAEWRAEKIGQRAERLETAAEKVKVEKLKADIEKFKGEKLKEKTPTMRRESLNKKMQQRRQQRKQRRKYEPGQNRQGHKLSPQNQSKNHKSLAQRRAAIEKKVAKAKAASKRANDTAAKAKHQVEKIETVAQNARDNLLRERAKKPMPELGSGAGILGGLAARGGQKILDKAHSTISEIEDDIGNSGVKLAHGVEQRAENAIRSSYRRLRRIGRKLKQRAEREVIKKLKHGKTAKAGATKASTAAKKKATVAAKKAARKKLMLAKAKAVKVKAVAGKSAFMAGKTTFLAGKTAVSAKAGAATGGISLAVQAAIYAAIVIALLLFIVIVILVIMLLGLIGTLGGGFSTAIYAGSYAADPHEMTAASVHMTELQVEFVENIHEAMQEGDEVILIINGETFTFPVSIGGGHGGVFLDGSTVSSPIAPNITPPDVPEIPSLRALLPNISHCPWEVMAYLTILYRDFEGVDIFEILEELFGEVYLFSYTTHTETRTHTVPVAHYVTTTDGIIQVNPTTMQISVSIEVRTVTVTTNGTISEAISARLDDWTETVLEYDENFEPLPHDHFEFLMATGGLRQMIFSPFEEDWRGNLSSPFGYRFHPVYGHRHFHTGIDIGMPEGTPILSGILGEFTVVTASYLGGYGYTVIIEATCPDSGMTIRLLYAHMETILVDVGVIESTEQIVLGTVGQTGTATGAHLHMEVFVRMEGETDFRLLNPAFFVLPEII